MGDSERVSERRSGRLLQRLWPSLSRIAWSLCHGDEVSEAPVTSTKVTCDLHGGWLGIGQCCTVEGPAGRLFGMSPAKMKEKE